MESISSGHADAFMIQNDKLYKYSKTLEYTFYKELNDENNKHYKENQILKDFCPAYFGEIIQNEKKYIILENLFYNLPNASSIDFKIGRQTCMPDAPQQKIENEIKKSKESTGEALGFRISGFQQKDSLGQIKIQLKKEAAFTTIKEEDLEQIMTQLLKSNDAKQINENALMYFIERIESLIKFFQEQSTRFFIASSIFLLCDNISKKFVLKFIDFAHYGELKENKRDENVLEGLKNLLKIFKIIENKL